MNRDELLWASGLFEGEGCITVSRQPKYRTRLPHLTLSSTDKDTLERFYRAIGSRGSVIFRRRHRGAVKPIWQWSLASFEGVQAVVAMLWFGLGARRRARAKELLQAYLRSKRQSTKPYSVTYGAVYMRNLRLTKRDEINARRRKGDPRRLPKAVPFLDAIEYAETFPEPLLVP